MAIQVGGTNVITDARALNNITSADTATKNALAAAGVGGQTTLITDRQSFSTSALQISLPDYTIVRVLLFKVRNNTNNFENIRLKLTNSSGSEITSTTYNFRLLDGSQYNAQNQVILNVDNPASTDNSNSTSSMILNFYNAYDSDANTMFQIDRHVHSNNITPSSSIGTVFMAEKQRNQHVKIVQQQGNSFSGYYSVWGIS